MKLKQFTLEEWFRDKTQKVVDSNNLPLQIRRIEVESQYPVHAMRPGDSQSIKGYKEEEIFIVEEDNESEFSKELQNILLSQHGRPFTDEEFDSWAEKLKSLVKESEELPTWKSMDLPMGHGCVDISNLGPYDYVRRNGFYLSVEDLDKLQKPETFPEEFKKSLELIIKEALVREDWRVNLDADSELLYCLAKRLLLEKDPDFLGIKVANPSELLRLIKQQWPLEFASMIGPEIKSAQIEGKEKALKQMPKWKADADFSSGQSIHNGRLYSYGLSIRIEDLLDKLPKPEGY